jgi:hypothetical protein
MPRVLFLSNVESSKIKTEFSFLQTHCKGTELLLKKLKILGPNEKSSKKFHI